MESKKEKLDGLLKQLAHPVRLSILCNLARKGEMSVSEIVEAEGGAASQSQVSQFLGRMRSEGLVKTHKEGQTVNYSIDSPKAKKVVEALYAIYCGTN
ncbi:ArsR/SmtB family transcription factor [Estrella lausannensis]|uniref:Transcriptional repressor, ArsR family n=1 Tax=Estrella lausannensis TaxID=483423 RepID=A0A0H5DSP1_9BACT|nr:metalloregulator ArsR/SmtB family transcription factor [Estrella lausannensis]CRX39333.1 Transcriptional repressor, ArsR family [Estrella lausannensis]